MIDEKLMAYGRWLQGMVLKYQQELLSVCGNDNLQLPTVKRKFGQLEAYQYALQTFSELYNGDLNKFNKEYLDIKEDSEDDRKQVD